MINEKRWHDPVGFEHYRPGGLFSHEEDRHFALEDGKEWIPEVDTH
jgi:hypothetical protein